MVFVTNKLISQLPLMLRIRCQFLPQPEHPTNDDDDLLSAIMSTSMRTIRIHTERLEAIDGFGFGVNASAGT